MVVVEWLGVFIIKVAKELKEEKRLRWKTEDDLVSAQAVISKLRGKVKEQSEQVFSFYL